MQKKFTVFLLLSVFFMATVFIVHPVSAAEAPFADVDKANIFLKEFEKEVERARGNPNTRFFSKQEALTRIKQLNELYPDDPRVKDLMRRASVALQKSMGDFREITPAMLAYKNNEKELRERFRNINQTQWKKQIAEKDPVLKVFPAPVAEEVDVKEYLNRYIVLENVKYPSSVFVGATGEYMAVGRPSSGYYFVSMEGRHWAGPYEAIRRYRSLVDSSLGDNLEFSILGKITGLVTESPDSSADKIAPFVWGWIVEPEMIYTGDRVVAVYDPKHENSGYFFGEDQVESIKDAWYTVKSVPDNVDPKRLMEIFATAIKEKNYSLYLECIYPDRKKTDLASSLLRYHWDLHQNRFQNEYVYVEFDDPEITVIKGFDESNDLDNYFLNPDQRDQMKKMGGEKEEMAVVQSRAYDINGRQTGSKNRHELRRKGNGRWYINTYDVRF